jgi:hypothetical protein
MTLGKPDQLHLVPRDQRMTPKVTLRKALVWSRLPVTPMTAPKVSGSQRSGRLNKLFSGDIVAVPRLNKKPRDRRG